MRRLCTMTLFWGTKHGLVRAQNTACCTAAMVLLEGSIMSVCSYPSSHCSCPSASSGGGGPKSKLLAAMIEDHDLGGRVTLAGPIAHERAAAFLVRR